MPEEKFVTLVVVNNLDGLELVEVCALSALHLPVFVVGAGL